MRGMSVERSKTDTNKEVQMGYHFLIKYNINKHNMAELYKIRKNWNEIQLTKKLWTWCFMYIPGVRWNTFSLSYCDIFHKCHLRQSCWWLQVKICTNCSLKVPRYIKNTYIHTASKNVHATTYKFYFFQQLSQINMINHKKLNHSKIYFELKYKNQEDKYSTK